MVIIPRMRVSELRGNNEWVSGGWGGVQYDVEYTVHTHNGRGRSGDCLWVFTLYVRYVCMYLCM